MTVIVEFETGEFDTDDAGTTPSPRRRHATFSGRTWSLQRVGRILSGTALAAVALTAIACAVIVVSMRLAFAPVLSPSMEPAFGPGDLLVTKALPAAEIKVGDVLVLPIPEGGSVNGSGVGSASTVSGAEAGDRYVHRVISVTQRDGLPVVKTKGDNNEAVDPWLLRIDSPNVPQVVADVPNVGRLSLLTQAAWVRVALILMVAGFALVGIKRGLLDRG